MTVEAGRAFQELVDIMARLRGPSGCPWDRQQTLETLRVFLLEETHEVLDAIDRGDITELRGEIGDLLFQSVFLSQIAADAGAFTIVDALASIAQKLIRRHPHIFDPNGRPLETPDQVHQQWEQIKAKEQGDAGKTRSVLSGLPKSLPSLVRAWEIGTRVAAVGFDWPTPADVVSKIDEEVAELRQAVASEGVARTEEEMGDLLFSIAQLARKIGVEPESALRKANEKFTARFGAIEARLHAAGSSVHAASADEMERHWQEVKRSS